MGGSSRTAVSRSRRRYRAELNALTGARATSGGSLSAVADSCSMVTVLSQSDRNGLPVRSGTPLSCTPSCATGSAIDVPFAWWLASVASRAQTRDREWLASSHDLLGRRSPSSTDRPPATPLPPERPLVPDKCRALRFVLLRLSAISPTGGKVCAESVNAGLDRSPNVRNSHRRWQYSLCFDPVRTDGVVAQSRPGEPRRGRTPLAAASCAARSAD
jgi:hypothetical protein